MQKVINALAVVSFLGTASIVGGGYYLYTQKDAYLESAKNKLTAAAVEAVSSALPGLIDAAMTELPEVPTSTGPALPF